MMKLVSRHLPSVAVVALLASHAAPAAATVTAQLLGNVVTARTIDNDYNPPQTPIINFNSAVGMGGGVSITALSNVSNDEILFRNGIAAMGAGVSVINTTGVAITFTNTSDHVVAPVLDSTLLAAGVGVYMTAGANHDTQGSGCSAGALTACGSPTATEGENLYQDGGFGLASSGSSAARFMFDVSVGGASVYSLGGEVGLRFNDDTGKDEFYSDFNEGASGNAATILGIQGTTGDYADTFSWNDTDVAIPLNTLLDPGASVTAIYTIQTQTVIGMDAQSYIGPFENLTDSEDKWTVAAPIVYSSFGDPVGRAGTINPSAQALNMLVSRSTSPNDDRITGLDTRAVGHLTLGQDDYVEQADGTYQMVATVKGATYDDPSAPGALPEPSSWALMLGGFGLVGAAVRRRKTTFA
jgi:hypothetical protein